MTRRNAPRLAFCGFLAAATPCVLLVPSESARAFAEGEFLADIRAAIGYSNNPFLLPGSQGSAYAEISASPRYVLTDEVSRTTLEGQYRRTEYLEHFGSSSGYGASLQHERRLTERLEMRGEFGFDSSITGERFSALDLVDDEPPIPGDEPEEIEFDPDAPLLGLRQRRNAYRANLLIAALTAERDKITAGASLSRNQYPNSTSGYNFWGVGGNVAYLKSLSPITKVGGSLGVERVDFDRDGGAFDIYRPRIIYQRQLDTAWSLDASVGAVLVRGEGVAGRTRSTGLSGQLSACRKSERDYLCVDLARDAAGSGTGDVRLTQSAKAEYNYKLNTDDRLSASASYVRFSSDAQQRPSSRIFRASGGFYRQIASRVGAGAETFYRNGSNGLSGDFDDFGGQITLSYRFEERP